MRFLGFSLGDHTPCENTSRCFCNGMAVNCPFKRVMTVGQPIAEPEQTLENLLCVFASGAGAWPGRTQLYLQLTPKISELQVCCSVRLELPD